MEVGGRPEAVGPRLVSSAHGRIGHVLLCLPATFVATHRELAARLLAVTPVEADLTIVTHVGGSASVACLASLSPRTNVDLIVLEDEVPLSPWVQDGVLAFESAGPPRLAPTLSSVQGLGAGVMLNRLTALGWATEHTRALPARGGNLLVGDDFVLIGADEWRRWSQFGARCETDPERRALSFFRTLDAARRPIVVASCAADRPGPSRTFRGRNGRIWRENVSPGVAEARSGQPLFHLDMFITLAGRRDFGGPYRVLVGDPAAGADLAGLPSPSESIRHSFDAVARLLESHGFQVIRNPLPLVFHDNDTAHRRHWYYVSPNNCQVEFPHEGRPRVWLPQFGNAGWPSLRKVDAYMAELWTRLGVTVCDAGHCHALAQMGGGLNCATKVVRRGVNVRSLRARVAAD